MTEDLDLPESSAWQRFRLRVLAAMATPPEPHPPESAAPEQPAAPARLSLAMARIRLASGSAWPGPPNPAATWPGSTYEYRTVDAESWARAAGLTADESALAWCLASEADRIDLYPQYAIAIGEAVANDAATSTSGSIHARVTMAGVTLRGGRSAPAAGHYGRQGGRWCSSWQRPTERHVVAARAVLAARDAGAPLIGHGARRWTDMRVMRRGVQAGRKLAHDDLGIVRAWASEGWRWVGPILDAGSGDLLIDPYVLTLYTRTGGVSLAETERMVLDGRRRWRLA